MNDGNTTPESAEPQSAQPQPKWEPISAIERRILGVLAEKAKTTPTAYPMSLNAICTGANQKSNRFPLMNLEPENAEESLDRLRELGAVGMIEGYGRVSKYRHYLYEWLGADKVELAVMAELLLRGAQTVGELRGRAARMEPIRDVAALRPIVASLIAKGLVFSLTPEGRGQVVTHALYKPREMEKLQAQYGQDADAGAAMVPTKTPTDEEMAEPAAPVAPARESQPPQPIADPSVIEAFQREIGELRAQVAQLRNDVEDLTTRQSRTDDDLRDLRDALGA
ncbi:MAG TPA: DUF480 domain-containing protein [Thermoguttaceae bacterium]|nr:DUF480 domain-containing protein [Thermoguttaceae bacterium]